MKAGRKVGPSFSVILLAGAPLSLWVLQSPRKDWTIQDGTKELGLEGRKDGRGRGRTMAKTQEEELWSRKLWWGHRTLDHSFHQGHGDKQEHPGSFQEMGPEVF